MKAGTLPKSLKSAPPVPKSMFVGKLRLLVPPAFDLRLRLHGAGRIFGRPYIGSVKQPTKEKVT